MMKKTKTKFTETELGMIPEDWEILELQKMTEIIDSAHMTPKYSSNGFAMVRVTNIKSGFLDLTKTLKVTKEVYEKFTKKYKPKKNDIVMSRVGTYGITSYVDTDESFCLGQNTVIIHPLQNNHFIYCALNSKLIKNQIDEEVVGAVQKTISLQNIRELLIATPTNIKERDNIAEKIFTLDSKINLNQETNKTLNEICKIIFKRWFIDFEFPNKKNKPYKSSGGKIIYNEELVKKIPQGWEVKLLGNILSEIEVGNRPKGGVADFKSGIPSIGAESIVSIGMFDYSKTKYISNEFYKEMKKGHIKNMDVLLYKDGGKPGMFEPHITLFGNGFPYDISAINEHVYRLQTNEEITQIFLYFWLSSNFIMNEMRNRGTGAAIPGLNSTQVKSLPILIPNKEKIIEFQNQTEPLILKILLNSKENHNLTKIRDSLSPKLMSGKIRIPSEIN